MKGILSGLSIALLAGCATGYEPRYYFNELQAVNLTGTEISDVSITVVNSNKVVDCEKAAPSAQCQRKFGKRLYRQEGIQLNWSDAEGNLRSEALQPPIPAYYSTALALRIVMEINADGSVEAFYEQEEPGFGGGDFLAY